MKDLSENNSEFSKESTTQSSVSHAVTTATQRKICQNCGRDLSQPNLLPPANSSSCKNLQSVSRGHGICSQCGGLGAGLLDKIFRYY